MELKQALKTALDFEQKGYAVYWDIAQKTENPLLKKTFAYLAQQETYHISEIKNYISQEKIEITLGGDRILGVQKFFNLNIEEFRDKLELSQNDLKAHETALVLEQASYDFYKEQLVETKDKASRKFLLFLMEQENAHYELIQRTYEYLNDPVNFYVSDEKWFFDGG